MYEMQDHHDERFFLETVQDMAEAGECHVRKFEQWFVISPKPLTQKQVIRAMRQDQLDAARYELKDGTDPYEVLRMSCYVSAADIGRLMREEKIEAPHRWFSRGLKSEERLQRAEAEQTA